MSLPTFWERIPPTVLQYALCAQEWPSVTARSVLQGLERERWVGRMREDLLLLLLLCLFVPVFVCPPCRFRIPFLIALERRERDPFLGKELSKMRVVALYTFGLQASIIRPAS